MRQLKKCGFLTSIFLFAALGIAQQTTSDSSRSVSNPTLVPQLVNFSGILTDSNGKAITGIVGVTFSLYKDEQGGAPLWMETQNVQPNRTGHYTVTLGSTTSSGLPSDIFVTGEARWLGVEGQGLTEQPRVLLLSVPYALKAGDAETLGGLPASAFMLAAPTSSAVNNAEATSTSASTPNSAPPATNVTGSGVLDFVPLWTSTSNIANSVLFQSGSGSTAKVGINTTTPAATLDVKGTENVEGLLTLPATGTATSAGGKPSQAQDLVASSFNRSTSAAVNQTFQWTAEATGNNTATPSGTLNLLFGRGTVSPTETGLKVSDKGLFTFATGQTFPGTGTISGITTASGSGLMGGGTSGSLTLSLLKTCSTNQILQWKGSSWVCASAGTGTVTGVTAGTDLTGGGTSGNVTLNLDTTKVPLLNAANTFIGNQAIAGNLSDTGNISATGSVTGQTGAFTGNSSGTSAIITATQQGAGEGMFGSAAGVGGIGIQGSALNTSGVGKGVEGDSYSTTGIGVLGGAFASSGNTIGVSGVSFSAIGVGVSGRGTTGVMGTGMLTGIFGTSGAANGQGVWGLNNAASLGTGVYGVASGAGGVGVFGETVTSSNSSPFAAGVQGVSYNSEGKGVWGTSLGNSVVGTGYSTLGIAVWGDSAFGVGVLGTSDQDAAIFGASTQQSGVYGVSFGSSVAAVTGNNSDGAGFGVFGSAGQNSGQGQGVWGEAFGTGFSNGAGSDGVHGVAHTTAGAGVAAINLATSGGAVAVYGTTNDPNGYGGEFFGNVSVSGAISAGSKDFKIDHPLDPANKYLYHASVESSEMMNIYTGNVTTDFGGSAVIQLPEWFETLNGDFRYQLTVIGQFAQAIVANEIENHRFSIRTDKSNVKVSWQVTGVRQDRFAKAHPLVVEAEKIGNERGTYLHPDLYGAPKEAGLNWARHRQPQEAADSPKIPRPPLFHQPAAGQSAPTRNAGLRNVFGPPRPVPVAPPVMPAAPILNHPAAASSTGAKSVQPAR